MSDSYQFFLLKIQLINVQFIVEILLELLEISLIASYPRPMKLNDNDLRIWVSLLHSFQICNFWLKNCKFDRMSLVYVDKEFAWIMTFEITNCGDHQFVVTVVAQVLDIGNLRILIT